MLALPKSRLLRFVEQAYHLARRAVTHYSSKFSKRRYTLHQHIVLFYLKVRKNTTYRTLLDELIEMPRVRKAIDLEELPSPPTLCKAFNWLDMTVWRILLNHSVAILLGDKGYDDQKIRALAREKDVRPLIKHREFSSLHKAWNARLDADFYGQRSQNETVNSLLKRKYGPFVRSRQWWNQFRELAVGCLTHNIDKAL